MQQEIEGRLIGQVIKIDEAPISYHLGKVVRETVEETLNAILLLVTGSPCNSFSSSDFERTTCVSISIDGPPLARFKYLSLGTLRDFSGPMTGNTHARRLDTIAG